MAAMLLHVMGVPILFLIYSITSAMNNVLSPPQQYLSGYSSVLVRKNLDRFYPWNDGTGIIHLLSVII